MKISIIYHSQSGNTKKMAELIAAGVQINNNIEKKIMEIDNIDNDFISDSKAIIFGCPTYAGSVSWQMKKFLDTTEIDFEGKLGSVFATAGYIGGGAEFAEINMISSLLVRGMLIYSAGFTKGSPITHFGVVSIKGKDDSQQERSKIFGKRIAEKALELFK